MLCFLWCSLLGSVAIFSTSPEKPLHIVSQICQCFLITQIEEVIFYFTVNRVLANEFSEKTFFWVSHGSHAEFILVGFRLGLIFADPFNFSSFWLSLPVVPVGEDCVWRVSEPECCACRPLMAAPSLQAVSHLCTPVSTPSYALTLQTALNIFQISFL